MNDHITLVTMYHDAEDRRFETVGVCSSGGCWEKANELGFYSRGQRERRAEASQSNVAT
jgi:hypothetical protein